MKRESDSKEAKDEGGPKGKKGMVAGRALGVGRGFPWSSLPSGLAASSGLASSNRSSGGGEGAAVGEGARSTERRAGIRERGTDGESKPLKPPPSVPSLLQSRGITGYGADILCAARAGDAWEVMTLYEAQYSNYTARDLISILSRSPRSWRERYATGLDFAALMFAAEGGYAVAVRALLAGGVNCNAQGWNRWTALLWAARYGHAEIVRDLIAAGANFEDQFHDGPRVLIRNLRSRTSPRLPRSVAPAGTALMLAAEWGHSEIVRDLLAGGATCDARCSEGRTALMLASMKGHSAIVGQLLTAGADCNAPDIDGLTPLMLASANGCSAIMRQLLAAGADCNAQDRDGYTALILAVLDDEADCVAILLSEGAENSLQTSAGDDAFSLAVGYGRHYGNREVWEGMKGVVSARKE